MHYSKATKAKLQWITDNTPHDTPHYQRANDELIRRNSRRGVSIPKTSLAVASASLFIAAIANADKLKAFWRSILGLMFR